MKNKKAFLLIPLLAIPSLMGAVITSVYMSFNTIGPFSKYQNDVSFEYTLNNRSIFNESVYEFIIFGNKSVPIGKTIKTATHSIKGKETVTCSVNLPTSMLLGDDGMSIHIELRNSSDKVLKTKEFTIYPSVSQIINPLTTDYYESKEIIASMTNDVLLVSKETMTFHNFFDYFTSSTYYKLNLDQFSISWQGNLSELTMSNSYLFIDGYREYFPGLTYSNGKAKIPLKMVKNNDGTYHLSFMWSLYVEPKTLIMTTEPRIGYKPTNSFFFPINKKRDLRNLQIMFELNNVGLGKNRIAWSSKLLAANNLIGNCQDSEYCVVGEVEE